MTQPSDSTKDETTKAKQEFQQVHNHKRKIRSQRCTKRENHMGSKRKCRKETEWREEHEQTETETWNKKTTNKNLKRTTRMNKETEHLSTAWLWAHAPHPACFPTATSAEISDRHLKLVAKAHSHPSQARGRENDPTTSAHHHRGGRTHAQAAQTQQHN